MSLSESHSNHAFINSDKDIKGYRHMLRILLSNSVFIVLTIYRLNVMRCRFNKIIPNYLVDNMYIEFFQ